MKILIINLPILEPWIVLKILGLHQNNINVEISPLYRQFSSSCMLVILEFRNTMLQMVLFLVIIIYASQTFFLIIFCSRHEFKSNIFFPLTRFNHLISAPKLKASTREVIILPIIMSPFFNLATLSIWEHQRQCMDNSRIENAIDKLNHVHVGVSGITTSAKYSMCNNF